MFVARFNSNTHIHPKWQLLTSSTASFSSSSPSPHPTFSTLTNPIPKSEKLMASPPPPPPSTSSHLLALPSSAATKKTPPLPWTHEETLNLIHSYQQKWYSLKRGQLKASQWDQVSFAVPTKTSTQCRHKMEKLRKRYRAERVKPYPNSWLFFQLMDDMERGPFPLMPHPVSAVKMQTPDVSDFDHNDESDSDDNAGFTEGVDVRKNKCKSIDDILRGGSGIGGGYSSRDYNENGGIGSSVCARDSRRIPGVRESLMMDSRKRRGCYEDSEDEEDDEDLEVDVDGDGGDGGKELAEEIRGFAEKFMRVEKMRIEMTRETERYRREMEKRRMEMIIDSQRKIVDTIGRAFRAHKKLNTGPESSE